MGSRSPASPQAPRGSHQHPGGAGRASGSPPKDITFTTCARDSMPRTGRHEDLALQTRAFLARRHTSEGDLAWKAGDLGPRAGSGTSCGAQASLVPTKPQVFI